MRFAADAVSRRRSRLAILGPVLLAISSGANAGPPYETDDPQPTDTGGWEIYAFATGTRAPGQLDGSTGVDLNYGPVPGVQLTATLPVDFRHEKKTLLGVGDVELGVKYRFFHREKQGVGIAIFPRLILPTAGSRFGSGKVAALLPVWAQKDLGPWSVFGGGGYAINPGRGNRDYWVSGLAATRTVSQRLSLGGEVTHSSADAVGGPSTTSLGVGAVYALKKPYSLLFSAGPTFSSNGDPVEVHAYLALGLNF